MHLHPESARRPADPPPLRHPHFETFRQRQAADFRAEVAASVRYADELRHRMAGARVLEALH